jgi:hypothetical protein
MVVIRRARDIRMLAGWKVHPFHEPELRQDVEGTEDRGATDADPTRSRIGHERGRREVTRLVGDELRHSTPWLGHPVAGPLEGSKEGNTVDHVGEGSRFLPMMGLSLRSRRRCDR